MVLNRVVQLGGHILPNTLKDLGFTSCLADPDVWFRAAKKPDGYEYYEYILV
jgi:hypothetical protein